jgi:hypothetical protein
MSNLLKTRHLNERSGVRTLVAISFCAAMAAFGCTTDRNLGNGDPVVTPGVRSVPTGGSPSGSESEPLPPPMMSSYQGLEQPQMRRLSANEAAAIMAQQQRVRVLGPVSPDNGGRPYVSDLMIPQQQREVRYSVNSTIYSQPTEAVTSGAGEPVGSDATASVFADGVRVDSGGTTATAIAGSSVATGTTASSTAVTNAGAPLVAPSGTTVTPTSNSLSTPSGFASVRTLSPTAAAVVNPPASISGSPAVASTSSANARTRTVASTSTMTTTTSAGVTSPVRVLTSNGRLTITNTGSTRQQ